jgi:hypothetical protein
MTNSLSWGEDNWDDFAHWLKQQFDIEIPDEECRNIHNVGGLYDAVMVRMPPAPGNQKCAGAMAFYRLRQALNDIRAPTRIFPSTPLNGIDSKLVKEVLRGIGNSESFHVPRARDNRLCRIIFSVTFLAFVASFVLGIIAPLPAHDVTATGVMVPLAIAGLGVVILQRFPDRPPEDCRAVGDLAKRIAAYNYGHFVQLGAKVHEDEVWDAMCEGLVVFAALRTDEVTRETVFYDRQLKAPRVA